MSDLVADPPRRLVHPDDRRHGVLARVLGVLVVVLILVPVVGTGAAAADPSAAQIVSACPGAGRLGNGHAKTRRALRCAINLARTDSGLRPLRTNRKLTRVASVQAGGAARAGRLSHMIGGGFDRRLRRAHYSASRADEALGMGTGRLGSPAAIVRSWLASPVHRRIVLDRRARDMGVGRAGRAAGIRGTGATWALEVARRH